MSDLVRNPQDRFSHNEAHIISDDEHLPILLHGLFDLDGSYDLIGGK